MSRYLSLWLVAIAACGVFGVANAQPYPTKPVRFVVTAPPGGGVDILARQIGQVLAERLKQPFVIDNRAGGNGVIGVDLVARSAADGHTLMVAGNNFMIFPLLGEKVSYDPIRDFAPVTLAVTSPNILVIHPSVAANSVSELIALARSQPGKLNYATGSSGAAPHMAGELFKYMAKVDIVRVPYKGGAPAITDLVGGQVQLMFSNAMLAFPHMKSGRLKALGITSARRSPVAPDLVPLAESGLPGFEAGVSFGLLMRAGTSDAIISLLNTEVVSFLGRPEVRSRLLLDGSEAVGGTPEDYARVIRQEITRWGAVIKVANIRLE